MLGVILKFACYIECKNKNTKERERERERKEIEQSHGERGAGVTPPANEHNSLANHLEANAPRGEHNFLFNVFTNPFVFLGYPDSRLLRQWQ